MNKDLDTFFAANQKVFISTNMLFKITFFFAFLTNKKFFLEGFKETLISEYNSEKNVMYTMLQKNQ